MGYGRRNGLSLVVDDEEDKRDLFIRKLKKQMPHAEIIEVSSLPEVLEKLNDSTLNFSALVLDNGFYLYKDQNMRPKGSRIGAMLLGWLRSGEPDADQLSAEMGLVGREVKPLDLKQFQPGIERYHKIPVLWHTAGPDTDKIEQVEKYARHRMMGMGYDTLARADNAAMLEDGITVVAGKTPDGYPKSAKLLDEVLERWHIPDTATEPVEFEEKVRTGGAERMQDPSARRG